jgi:hypothetical protein
MDHNIRDRKDFYGKFDNFFDQLVLHKNNRGVFLGTAAAIIEFLEYYITSSTSDNDSLMPLLTYLKLRMSEEYKKITKDPSKEDHYAEMFKLVSNCASKIADYRKKEEEKTMSSMKVVHKKRNGVEFVFSQSSALEKLGTSDQYLEYLDTIFPNSTITDIVYHGTDSMWDYFYRRVTENSMVVGSVGIGFYFIPKSHKYASRYLIPAILNIEKPLLDLKYNIYDFGNRIDKTWREPEKIVIHKEELYTKGGFNEGFVGHALSRIGNIKIISSAVLSQIFTDVVKSLNHDSIIYRANPYGGEDIVVFNLKQIHILGSKQDIEKFRDFRDNQKSDSNIQIRKTG